MGARKPVFTLRKARKDDAAALARLIDIAAEGMASYFWRLSAPDADPLVTGAARAAREEGGFSYRNAVVAERDGRTAGTLIGYGIGEDPEPVTADMPAMFVPLQELENLALGTWYVNVLAVLPGARNLGIGSTLLDRADEIGRAGGKRGMSIIVSDANEGARRLYERHGYRETAKRTMVKDGWENGGRNWVLLAKDL